MKCMSTKEDVTLAVAIGLGCAVLHIEQGILYMDHLQQCHTGRLLPVFCFFFCCQFEMHMSQNIAATRRGMF